MNTSYSIRSRAWNWFMKFLIIFAKSAKLLKIFKTAKLLKPLITVMSMSASVFVYSFSLGIWFSVGFVLMLFVHEMGHIIALKRKGLPASAPVFIPMLGAVIFAPDMGARDDEAYIGIAGPIIGSLGAVAVLVAALTFHEPPELLLLIGYTALLINVFNLIPLRPLDGGRVTQAIGPWFKIAGIGMLLALTLALQSPGMLLIWILVLGDIRLGRFRAPLGWSIQVAMGIMALAHIGEPQPWWLNVLDQVLASLINLSYGHTDDDDWDTDHRPQVPRYLKWMWLGRYIALCVILVLLMVVTHGYLPDDAVR